MAQSGHPDTHNRCPLSGVKRTFTSSAPMSAFDPKRTSGPEDVATRNEGRTPFRRSQIPDVISRYRRGTDLWGL